MNVLERYHRLYHGLASEILEVDQWEWVSDGRRRSDVMLVTAFFKVIPPDAKSEARVYTFLSCLENLLLCTQGNHGKTYWGKCKNRFLLVPWMSHTHLKSGVKNWPRIRVVDKPIFFPGVALKPPPDNRITWASYLPTACWLDTELKLFQGLKITDPRTVPWLDTEAVSG